MTLPAGHEVAVWPDAGHLVEGASERLADVLASMTWPPRWVLSGGKTPIPVYVRMGSMSRVPWTQLRFTFGDERCVPPEHPDSNYGAAKAALFDPLGIPGERVLRIRGEDPPERGAEKTHRMLVEWSERVPLFDLVLLGLGSDGHVASLFPAESWPAFGTRLAAWTQHPSGGERVTLTPEALRSTRLTVFLVSGAGKAEAVRDALGAEEPSPRVPARMVTGPEGRVLWCLDRAAAALLPADALPAR